MAATTVALLGVACASAIGAGFASGGFLWELNLSRPALSDAPPVIDPAPTPRRTRRVILVIVDGLRERDTHELPALERMRRDGTSTTAASQYPTWSRPNYVSILTGVPPHASGVRTNHHPAHVALDSLMDRARAGGLACALASDYEALPRTFLRRAADGSYGSPCETTRFAPWAGGTGETVATVATGDAALAVLHIGGVDRAGHRYGAASDAYRAAAREADRAIAQLLASVDLEHDAVIVTADHGHVDRGGHGGIERVVVEVPLVAAGAGIRRGARVDGARLIDIAPTIAALLGLPAPGHGLGRTLVELLDLAPAALRARVAADRARLVITGGIVAAEQARGAAALATRRAVHATLAIALAMLAIAAGVVLVRRRVLRVDPRALAIAILAVAVSYVAALVFGASSVSALPGRAQLVPVLLGAAGCAIAVHVGACAWAVRHHRDPIEQLAAANAIAWLALVLALIPAGVLWVAFSPPYQVLPDAGWLAEIPVAFASVACAAVAVAFGLARSLFAFLARVVRTGFSSRHYGTSSEADANVCLPQPAPLGSLVS